MDPFSDQFQIWVLRMDPFHNQVWIQIFIYQSVYNIYNDDGQLIIIIVRNTQTIIFTWKSSPKWWWYAIRTHIYIWMKIIRTIFCASHRINFWASRPTNDQVRPLQKTRPSDLPMINIPPFLSFKRSPSHTVLKVEKTYKKNSSSILYFPKKKRILYFFYML